MEEAGNTALAWLVLAVIFVVSLLFAMSRKSDPDQAPTEAKDPKADKGQPNQDHDHDRPHGGRDGGRWSWVWNWWWSRDRPTTEVEPADPGRDRRDRGRWGVDDEPVIVEQFWPEDEQPNRERREVDEPDLPELEPVLEEPRRRQQSDDEPPPEQHPEVREPEPLPEVEQHRPEQPELVQGELIDAPPQPSRPVIDLEGVDMSVPATQEGLWAAVRAGGFAVIRSWLAQFRTGNASTLGLATELHEQAMTNARRNRSLYVQAAVTLDAIVQVRGIDARTINHFIEVANTAYDNANASAAITRATAHAVVTAGGVAPAVMAALTHLDRTHGVIAEAVAVAGVQPVADSGWYSR